MPARSGGRGWMIVALVLAAILAMTWLGGMIKVILRGTTGTHRHLQHPLEEVVLEDNDASDKIAVIEISGIITSEAWDGSGLNMVEHVSRQLKAAAEKDDVKAVLLKVNSPGGEVMASDDISQAIVDFQVKSKKPIVATMSSLAASGGYYVSVPCDWIVANPLTITGSIGVIMPGYNYRGLMDKIGIRPEVYKSGRFKDMMSGSKREEEIQPEERQMVQALIDETFAKFKEVVSEGRGNAYAKNKNEKARPLNANWEQLADGRILTGKQAYDNGFVDELGNFEAAVARTKKLANISKANLVRYAQPFDLANLFRLLGKSEAPALKIDLGVELPKLQLGRMYFLSSTIVH